MNRRLLAIAIVFLLAVFAPTLPANAAASYNIVYTSASCDVATSTVTAVGYTTLSYPTDTYSNIYVNNVFIVMITHTNSQPNTTYTFAMPISGYVTLHLGDIVKVTNLNDTSEVTATCGSPVSSVTTASVNVWGVTNARAVEWQFQAADGKWYWVVDSNLEPIQTPIEYRDRTRNGVAVPHYAISSLVIRVGGDAPVDVTKYRVYDADTHKMFHEVWIEIGNSSVFIP